MKVGDLVKTICFGPAGTLGELGIVVGHSEWSHCWRVLFGNELKDIAESGLEVINESR
jgi:hypothetical protein